MPRTEDEGIFTDRRRALEEAFFRKQDEKLIQQIRARQGKAAIKEVLARTSSTIDDALLDKLLELGLSAETLPAFGLVPLIAVAWADGKVDKAEREEILKAADAGGITKGLPGYQMLETWLTSTPDPTLIRRWEDYARVLASGLTPAEKMTLKDDIIGRARAVAQATGGFVGLGSRISAAEERALQRLARAFGD